MKAILNEMSFPNKTIIGTVSIICLILRQKMNIRVYPSLSLAACAPTNRSPPAEKEMTEGVVRAASAFSITFGISPHVFSLLTVLK